MGKRYAISRQTSGASFLENYLDSEKRFDDLFNETYFDDLEDVANEIESYEVELESKLENLTEENEDLKHEIEQLKNQLEELQ